MKPDTTPTEATDSRNAEDGFRAVVETMVVSYENSLLLDHPNVDIVFRFAHEKSVPTRRLVIFPDNLSDVDPQVIDHAKKMVKEVFDQSQETTSESVTPSPYHLRAVQSIGSDPAYQSAVGALMKAQRTFNTSDESDRNRHAQVEKDFGAAQDYLTDVIDAYIRREIAQNKA